MAAKFNDDLQCIECTACGEQVPLSRYTLRNPDKFSEVMSMARELHKECSGSKYEAGLSRRWREVLIRARTQGVTFAGQNTGN